jgi:hypothetical protein
LEHAYESEREKELAALRKTSVGQLKEKYAEVYRSDEHASQGLARQTTSGGWALAEGDLRKRGGGLRNWLTMQTSAARQH